MYFQKYTKFCYLVIILISFLVCTQSTERVLILEYMDGVRLNDSRSLESLGVNKKNIVEEITRAYAHQIFVDGFFNADPHPGNVSTIFLFFGILFNGLVFHFKLHFYFSISR